MKDRLEDFIRENRSGFDELEPRQESWSKISGQLSPKRDYQWVWKAAAILLLVLSGVLLYERNTKDQLEEPSMETMALSEELLQAESFYTEQIASKRLVIQTAVQDGTLDNAELLNDLNELDEMYVGLKNNLERNENNERLINAMIMNLQMRVEILNKQLKILERLKKYQEDETII